MRSRVILCKNSLCTEPHKNESDWFISQGTLTQNPDIGLPGNGHNNKAPRTQHGDYTKKFDLKFEKFSVIILFDK